MGKLHELLAIEPDLKNQAESILAETVRVFEKGDLFQGFVKTFQPVNENGERFPDEKKELASTVKDKLNWTEKSMVRFIDCVYQKESANTHACADLTVDGQLIATGIPATVLLALENKLKHLREMYRKIPTLETGTKWTEDVHQRNVYVSDTLMTHRTQKVMTPLVKYPATDKHPAQVDVISEDKVVGHWSTVHYSGKLPSAKKADLLERLENLIECVKRARCNANNAETDNREIGLKLFAYINHGTVS